MLAEMHKAIAEGKPDYTVAPGIYRFGEWRPIRFGAVKNFTLNAANVEFIFNDPKTVREPFLFTNCTNVTVKGPLVIESDPFAYTQATVIGSNSQTGEVTLKIMAGYDTPAEGGKAVFYAFTPEGRFIPQVHQELSDFKLIDATNRIVTAKAGKDDVASKLQPGNPVVIGSGLAAFSIIDSSVTLMDIDCYTGGVAWGMSNKDISFIGVRGIPRPGTNRLLGGCAPQMTGFQDGAVVRFENGVYQNCNDDALNVSGAAQNFMAYRQDAPATLVMYGGSFAAGSDIEIYDSKSFGLKSRGTVRNVEKLNDAAMKTDARSVLTSVTKLRDVDLGDLKRVTFDKGMVMDPGDIAAKRSERAESIIVRNCYFYGSGHAIALQSFKNTLFEDNVVETVNSGLQVVANIWWWEGSGAENITVRNNTFLDTATSFSRGQSAINIGIQGGEVGYTATHLARNILIEGNAIRSSRDGGIFVGNSENAVIRNNLFHGVEKSMIELVHVEHVSILSNYADQVKETPFSLRHVDHVEIESNILSNLRISPQNLTSVTNGRNVRLGENQFSTARIAPPTMPAFPLFVEEVNVRAPNGGESWMSGTSRMIYWSPGSRGNVRIELLRNDTHFSTITDNTPNTGSSEWTIPANQPTGPGYRIRISSLAQPAITDTSNADFAIAPVSAKADPSTRLGPPTPQSEAPRE
jgi:parallel beta-helix repeat protein